MKHRPLDNRGFTHYVAVLAVVTVAVIGGVFVMVLKAHNSTNARSAQASNTTSNSSSTGSSQKSPTEQTTANASPSNSSKTNAPSTQKTTTTSTSKSTASTGSSPASSSTPAATPAPTQTPLSVLTTLITNLDNGAQVSITTSAVTVPGPISNAQARPIVFTANGKVYFAYRQGSAPNFTTSASQTASSMAIVAATVSNPPLEQAHLDKAANLVDPNISNNLVGYSQGGN